MNGDDMKSRLSALLVAAAMAGTAVSLESTGPASANLTGRPPIGVWTDLFATPGAVTQGWTVRDWYNVADKPDRPVSWTVRDGILYGSGEANSGGKDWTGTWLLSEHEYGDFVLELEFAFKNGGYRGNGGIALRAPLAGDPAYDGMEIQITDERYERSLHRDIKDSQLTGSIYLVKAPSQSAYKPGEWNRYKFDLRGPKVKIWLNDVPIQDVDMKTLTQPALMHRDEKLVPAKPGAERPLRGHIGIQDLSASSEAIMIRNARIMPLN